MRSLIIMTPNQLRTAFCDELKKCGNRNHFLSIGLIGAHCGRITSDELFQLTFSGKFNFK